MNQGEGYHIPYLTEEEELAWIYLVRCQSSRGTQVSFPGKRYCGIGSRDSSARILSFPRSRLYPSQAVACGGRGARASVGALDSEAAVPLDVPRGRPAPPHCRSQLDLSNLGHSLSRGTRCPPPPMVTEALELRRAQGPGACR